MRKTPNLNRDLKRLRKAWLRFITCPIYNTARCDKYYNRLTALETELCNTYNMSLLEIKQQAGIQS